MKKRIGILPALLMCLIFTLPFAACTGGEQEKPVDPPVHADKVISVTIRYNDKDVLGVLNTDVSEGTIMLGARVEKTADDVDGTVTFTSSVTSVATVTNTGAVTLKAAGETVISAAAGDKKHQIVLSVTDVFAPSVSYTVTVVDGSADQTSAKPGTYVTLTATPPEHMSFVEWSFTVDGEPSEKIWQNGNVFAMPEGDVVATAAFTDTLYTLNVVGAVVAETGDGIFEGEAEDGGNYEHGDLPENEIGVYRFAFETPVTLEAIDEPAGKMFVGWDFESKKNRVGKPGDPRHSFEMPDEALTVWAVFSESSSLDFQYVAGNEYQNAGFGTITDGAVADAAADLDLMGMDGFRFSIKGDQTPDTGFGENSANIKGSNLATMVSGTQTIRVVLKNHHATLDATVEFFAEFYGNVMASGRIEVPAGRVVVSNFLAPLGFNNTNVGLRLRESMGGTAEDLVILDMGVQKADTYPDGDPLLFGSGATAKWVRLGGWGNQGSGWAGGQKNFFTETSTTLFAIAGSSIPSGQYIASKITNIPAYDEQSATTTVYARVTNNLGEAARIELGVGKNEHYTQDASFVSREIMLEAKGTAVIALEVPRSAGDENAYYVTFISRGVGALFNANVQFAYNNVFGYEEA